MSANRRKYPRVSIHVPVNYALLDEKGKIVSEQIGVALDISLGGVLLESIDFVATEYVAISFIDMENQVAQMKCKMAFSRKTDLGLVRTGLSFEESEAEQSDFAAKMIRAYFYRRKRLFDPKPVPANGAETAVEPLDSA
jgi:c-di-GMP-binding flagellar brake protein YcgR